ncbi:hypothetical protein ACRJ4W_35680 [Streptomyces sp. GLT-R25]
MAADPHAHTDQVFLVGMQCGTQLIDQVDDACQYLALVQVGQRGFDRAMDEAAQHVGDHTDQPVTAVDIV